MPGILGMDISISITSGRSLFAFSIASMPSLASPQINQSARSDSKARIPFRTSS